MLRRTSPDDEMTDEDREMYRGTRVYTFQREQDLLIAFRTLMRICDPDFVGGYNSKGFDMPYLVDSKFQLVCTKGYVNIDPTPPVHQVATEDDYSHEGFLFGDVFGQPVGFVRNAIEHFVNCCLTDAEPLITGEDGLHITRALAAMVESAETGEPVDL